MGRLHPDANWAAVSLLNVADVAPGLIAVYNIRTGDYVYVNRTSKRMLGYAPEAFLDGGTAFAASLIHPRDLKKVLAENGAALEAANRLKPPGNDAEPIVQFEYRMRHSSGRWVWLHTDGSVFSRTPEGEVEFVLNISIDITSAKLAEKKLRQLNQRLMALNQAKDEFISVASHQLRTPASGVKMYLGMLLEGQAGKLTKEQTAMAKAAYKGNDQQIKIINDLLSVARLDAGRLPLTRAEANLVKLLADVVARLKGSFGMRHQTAVLKTDVKRLTASVDKELLGMALEHIIDNAGKFSPEGETVNIGLSKTGNVLRIEISDKGLGIAKKDFKKIFYKFSRVEGVSKNQVDGTGLGLYWARRIITLHGGTVDLDSKPRQGTTFSVYLPIQT